MSSSDGARNGRCAAKYTAAIAYGTRPRAPTRVASDRPESETLIEAAHPVSLQIQGHVLIADRAKLARNGLRHLRIDRARQLVAPDLDPRQRLVMAHAADAEPELAQHGLGALDHAQL